MSDKAVKYLSELCNHAKLAPNRQANGSLGDNNSHTDLEELQYLQWDAFQLQRHILVTNSGSYEANRPYLSSIVVSRLLRTSPLVEDSHTQLAEPLCESFTPF